MFGLKAKYESLIDLQAIDSKIDNYQNELDNIEEKARFEELQKLAASLDRKENDLDKLNKSEQLLLDKQNGELDLLNQKIKNQEERLFGGTVSNPKELSALQEEVASLKRRSDEIENVVLEQMEKTTNIEAQLGQIRSNVEGNNKDAEKLKEVWLEKETDLKEKIEQETKKREAKAKEVDSDTLEDYEDIRANSGIGAGYLIDGVCQVCHVELPAMEFERIKKKEDYDFCPACSCILIVKEK